MLNSVSFCGSGNKAAAYQNNDKKSVQKPCKYAGALVGLGLVTNNVVKRRGVIETVINEAVTNGMSKGKAGAFLAAGMAIGAVLLTGACAFAGKMVGKAIDHFRKPNATKEA